MARGISIHIGLNEVDPAHYWTPRCLRACEKDAGDMAEIARLADFEERTVLLSSDAKSAAVRDALLSAAGKLESGDILLVTYAGHGSFVTDEDRQEVDRKDEIWCLFDRKMLDDELYGFWQEFDEGVRILLISDSCHSGTMAKRSARARVRSSSGEQFAVRSIPRPDALAIYEQHQDLYRGIRERSRDSRQREVRASVLQLSACLDWELAIEGECNGVFTGALRRVWDEGRFPGRDYLDFHAAIKKAVREAGAGQHPWRYTVGRLNPAFEQQRPFTI
ncbi:MAG: caspase family protein [Gemmatimonadota bacterium]